MHPVIRAPRPCSRRARPRRRRKNARDFPNAVTLVDALEVLPLMLDGDDPAFDSAAVRWVNRVTGECRGVARAEVRAPAGRACAGQESPRGSGRSGSGFTRTRRGSPTARTVGAGETTSTPRSPPSGTPSGHGARRLAWLRSSRRRPPRRLLRTSCRTHRGRWRRRVESAAPHRERAFEAGEPRRSHVLRSSSAGPGMRRLLVGLPATVLARAARSAHGEPAA